MNSNCALIPVSLLLLSLGCNPPSEELVGRYFQGDGLGYNLELNLRADGTFTCEWTGCLGHYGSTSGTWLPSKDMIELDAEHASGTFETEPISNILIVRSQGKERFVFVSQLDLLDSPEMLEACSFEKRNSAKDSS